jgi:RNA polymerase sigma factor (sigma-70 family)
MLSPAEANEPVVADDPFERAFHRRYGELYGLAYRVLGDRLEAEEIAQETFLRLTGAEVLDRPADEIAAWLRRVCLNLAFNRARDERRARARLERVGQLELADAGADGEEPERAFVRREEQAAVRRALAALPERQRECLLLRHSGCSYAEIAASLGIAVGSVGVILARAERAFRESYRERENGPSRPTW